ncbi:MFS general substrate transporter [Xylariaceae sp. FL1272]|nr:MFS general substrate transporter [Xylariaceae sp. FL1272]
MSQPLLHSSGHEPTDPVPVATPVTKSPDVEPASDGGEIGAAFESCQSYEKGFRLWAIVIGLGITNLLPALENTVVTTAAPVILSDLNLGQDYIWITNAFFLSSAVLLPLFGQLCDIFGRRWPMLTAISLFTLGSGICGGATNGSMLIAGRAIQGAGSGGIITLTSIIISDLVPLHYRANYIAALQAIYGIGVSLGPFIGGAIVSSTTWRWVFYINLPFGGVSLVIMFLYLNVKTRKHTTLLDVVRRINFLDNITLTASSVAILYSISYAGTKFPWSSWHTLVPLLLGFAGLFLFAAMQMRSFAPEPLMPPRLFRHRTSAIVILTTFAYSAILYWCFYFLPVYFQAVKLASPRRAGVALLPQSLVGFFGSITGGIVLSRWGRYKWLQVAAFGILTVGLGLFSTQDENTTVAEWATYQSIAAFGGGIIFAIQLPVFQSPNDEAEQAGLASVVAAMQCALIHRHQSSQATVTATWYFVRIFGHIWGVAIPAAIFDNRASTLLGTITDPSVREVLSVGGLYQYASAAFVKQFAPPIQDEIRHVFAAAVKRVFQISIVFGGVPFLLALFDKEVPLRKTIESEYGLDEKREKGRGSG